ncbi:MAG: hypothetical protein KGZ42_00040 [Melioribacter sp.]|nr:hypothetical protein [Melioribacter sp.]
MRQLRKLKLVFLLLAYGTIMQATIMREATIKEMTKEANLIVMGRVELIESRWSRDGKMIMTYVTVSINNVIKGDQELKNLVVEVPGGTIGDVTATAMGEARFHQNEEVLLFLVKNKTIPSATYFVVALCQGKFRIYSKSINNRNLLERNLEGITLVGKKGDFIPQYLDEILVEIRKYI